MTIEIQKDSDPILVKMIGVLDTGAAEQIETEIQEIESLAQKTISIDCSKLEYICSSGLRHFLRIRKAAGEYGHVVTLTGVSNNIMEVLKITHFDSIFDIQ